MSPRLKRLLKGMSAFIFLAACLILLRLLDPDADTLTRFVNEYVRSHGAWGRLLFVLASGVLTCFGLPRQLLSFVAGYAFGMIFGTLWATLGSTLGCMLSFSYARFVARSGVERRWGRQVAKVNALLVEAPLTMTVGLRLLPVGNNLLTSLLAGVSRIPALPFILGSCIGYVPQNLIFALLGSGIRVDPFWRGLLSAVLFIVSSLIGWWLYHHFKRHKPLPSDNEEDSAPDKEAR